MEIIKLSDIDFYYGEHGFSITDLNLSLFKGEFISVIGPNGSGKSTLIKIIANILSPIKGTAYLNNREYNSIHRKEFARNVAFVPQNSNTNFPFSVYEIVMMGRSPYLNFMGIEGEEDQKLVNNILLELEIDHLKYKGINEVSGGEAQRALIARALVQKPKILLLDEPNSHLDIKHQIGIFELLKKLNYEQELTIVAISHDLNFANNYSKRILMMKSGSILYDSIPSEILTVNNIKEVFEVDSKILFDSTTSKSIISLNV